MEPENLMSINPLKSSSLQSKKALLNAIQISSVFKGSSFFDFKFYSWYFISINLNSSSRYLGNLDFK